MLHHMQFFNNNREKEAKYHSETDLSNNPSYLLISNLNELNYIFSEFLPCFVQALGQISDFNKRF